MEKKRTVSLCMIVKNEEQYLGQCLESVDGVVDEIIVVDTGSTDKTKDIARQYTRQLFDFEWNNDFSAARNYSISKAHGDWILILDADEKLVEADKKNLKRLIRESDCDGFYVQIYNYVNMGDENKVVHEGFRLLKNSGDYIYTGAIHEQITYIGNERSKIETTDLAIEHYGYLHEVAKKKKKRKRNIPLIQGMLEQNPQNGFQLYNLGNEYAAGGDNEKAVEVYRKSCEATVMEQPYWPNLIYRLASCELGLGHYKDALVLMEKALTEFPEFIDMLYLKGICYEMMGRIVLAKEAYEACLDKEEPLNLQVKEGVTTWLPRVALGKLENQYGEPQKAVYHFTKAIELKSDLCSVLYPLGKAITEAVTEQKEQFRLIKCYFADFSSVNALLLFTDVLIHMNLLDEAKEYLEILRAKKHGGAYFYLKGKLYFQLYCHKKSEEAFLRFFEEKGERIFINSLKDSMEYWMLLTLLHGKLEADERVRELCKTNTEDMEYLSRLKGIYDYCKSGQQLDESKETSVIVEECITKLSSIHELCILNKLKAAQKEGEDEWI